MAETTEEFPALLAAVRQGDSQALARLCARYEPKVRIVARVLLGPALRPHLDSLDLVQSVHRTLIVGLREDRFDISSADKLVALAVTLVRRKVARRWRQLRRQQRLSWGAAGTGLPELLTSLSDSGEDPSRTVQLRDQVAHLCRHLDESERRMLELRSQGYSTAEIAEQLGLKHVTLRVRMTRLRERLRSAGVLDEWL